MVHDDQTVLAIDAIHEMVDFDSVGQWSWGFKNSLKFSISGLIREPGDFDGRRPNRLREGGGQNVLISK